jgi:hypothetical protein
MRYQGLLKSLLGHPRSRAPLGHRAARAAKKCCFNLALCRARPSALNLGCPISKSEGAMPVQRRQRRHSNKVNDASAMLAMMHMQHSNNTSMIGNDTSKYW